MITINVGKPAQKFNIHRDLLCHYSSYFKGALCNHGFIEGQTGIIELDDEKPQTFQIFNDFLYTGELCDKKEVKTNSDDYEDRTSICLKQTRIIEVWIFGDKRGIPVLQNKAIDLLHRHILESWHFDSSRCKHLYINTVEGSKLRQFVVEVMARIYGKLERASERYPNELLGDLCDRFREIRENASQHLSAARDKKSFWANLDLCEYHVHEGQDCKGEDLPKAATNSTVESEPPKA